MKFSASIRCRLCLAPLLFPMITLLAPVSAEVTAPKEIIAPLETALASAREASSEARQRLAVRRTIRDAETLLASHEKSPERFAILEFLFRANQQLIALDNDSKHREALLESARELVKAPAELAELRLEADLLLSQLELAKTGANAEARAAALRPFVDRYLDTPAGAKVVRIAMTMALELGDNRLVNDLRNVIAERYASDLDMVSFQRDKLGGQVFGAPFSGTFERSDGKFIRFPMDALGRSTMCVFWSKDEGGEALVKQLNAAALERKDELPGRLEIVSFNLDDLPDAGESIVRAAGADWQVMRLPGGRENPIYKAYVRSDPKWVTVGPTGQAAMIMSGSTRRTNNTDDATDYARVLQSTLARTWTDPRYTQQLAALTVGDSLVLDPTGVLDPTRPPELKALVTGEAKPLPRAANAVPEETLRAIQECFIPGPQRYRLTHTEARASYAKAVQLCRQAITSHPQAPDLWIVRNRLIVALLGLWKTDSDIARLEEAAAEAETAIAAGYPHGCDVIARFCLARQALRDTRADPRAIIDAFVAESGGESAPGPALAAAALLSLDVADRMGFEGYRERILKDHTENPMMWTFSAFLLDRHHRYWLFQVPFTAGWSYGRQESYFTSQGNADNANRRLDADFVTLDGKPFRIPQATSGKWTILAVVSPWDDPKSQPFGELARYTGSFINNRPVKDIQVVAAVLGGDANSIRASLGETSPEFPVVMVPGGLANPLTARLGILSEDQRMNLAVLRPDGTIAATTSGLVRSRSIPQNVIERHDEQEILTALGNDRLDQASERIFTLAPLYDPEAVDDRGRKLKAPTHSLAHLRARAQVYMALKDWDNALADAEEVVERQMATDGHMSLRTTELDDAEALRDSIIAQRQTAGAAP